MENSLSSHKVHKFAYRIMLVSFFLINKIDSEQLQYAIKAIPYILLSFDIILYSPREIFHLLVYSRKFRLFLISMYLGATINFSADISLQPHYVVREIVATQWTAVVVKPQQSLDLLASHKLIELLTVGVQVHERDFHPNLDR